MRIVIDMQGVQTESRFRGIGRYTLSLCQAIIRNRDGHEIILALNGLFPDTIEPTRAAFDGLLPQENIRVWHAPGPVKEEQPGNESRREVAELIREAFLASLQADVIHISSLFEGYFDDAVTSIGRFDKHTSVSVSLYDFIPLLNPDHYLEHNPRYAQYYERKVKRLKHAATCLAISDFIRQEGLEHLDVPADRMVNISTAVEPGFQPLIIDTDTAAQLRRKFGLTRTFILYTGDADERKNLPRLIQAYAALSSTIRADHQLLFAGKMSGDDIARFRQQAKFSGLKQDEVYFTGYVSDEELIQLYNLCKLFVCPSWHEGFGLPALEAMACGAPVIGADTSSIPEVIGMDEAMFDPLDVAAMSAKMAQALENESFRIRLREHGLRQAKRFSWDETAKRAIAAWEAQLTAQLRYEALSIGPGRKPKLAFVSPLPPEQTGIADYSAELLPALAEYYDIEVVVAQNRVDDRRVIRHAKVRDVSWLRQHAEEMDRVLYHFGNSPFHQHMFPLLREIPGTVALHDFFVSDLMAWVEHHAGVPRAWSTALYASHGYDAVRERCRDVEAAIRKYPVNFDVLRHAQGIVVHSEYSRQLARQWYGEGLSNNWVVIPLLRSPAGSFDKNEAKRQLGFDGKDFVVCSFGFMNATKLNHRLLDCWLNSALASNRDCHLAFIGENNSGNYSANLLQIIRTSGKGDRIRITGFVELERFRQYLMAADVAVQLRSQSRGETSAAVLDCMNYALPVILNASGSMAELERESVWMLPDEFGDDMLTEALETLWRKPERRQVLAARAREIVLHRHAPAECARQYAEAIERFYHRAETATPVLIRAIAAERQFAPGDIDLLRLSQAIATSLPLPRPAKHLFLDVTVICRNDLKTGIQRVARALLMALIEAPPPGFRIEPVYLSPANGEWQYRYARKYMLDLMGRPIEPFDDDIVEPECGDVLLGLDLSGDMLVKAQKAGLFARYRNKGVVVYPIVYDLLPVRMPEVFPPGAEPSHRQWLRSISELDGAVCISRAVADDFAKWQIESALDWKDRRPYHIGWFHLGGDVANSAPSQGMPDNAGPTLEQLKSRPSFLMVGTIEPRKGYVQTIEAFTQLWGDGVNVNLVIVGQEGWKAFLDDMRRDIPETVNQLRGSPERNNRLFWLEGISDEYLEKVYAACTCLIAASFGEGFGLPLIEAAQHKLPIMARDIPVFREVAGEHAYYFNAEEPKALAQAIESWLELYKSNQHPKSDAMSWLTWKQSAARLMQICIGKEFQH